MAKILIRSSDRRILFFTYDDRVSDVDPLIISIQEKFHNATDLIVTPRPPPNLKLGAYLNATLTDASPEPVEAHGRAFTRRRDFNAWLDAEIAKMNSPAIHGVPSISRERWYKYLPHVGADRGTGVPVPGHHAMAVDWKGAGRHAV